MGVLTAEVSKKMAKNQHGDQFISQYNNQYNTQYSSTFNSVFYNTIRPAFAKHVIGRPERFGKRSGIPSLPSLYQKRTDEVDSRFKSINIRTAFARKIYFTVLVQMAVLIGLQSIPGLFITEENKMIKDYCKPLHWVLFLQALICTVTLTISEFQRLYPHNYISLVWFTLSVGLLWMVSQNHYGTWFFLHHLAFATLCLFVYTCQTLFRYSVTTGVVIVLLFGGISFITMHNTQGGEIWETYYYKTYCWADFLSTLILLFFVTDIHFMVSGTHLNQIKSHECIYAAMSLYTDCINLVIYVLQFLNAAKRY